MFLVCIILTIGGSVVLTLQKAVNGALGKHIGSLQGSFVNHLVGALVAGALLAAGLATGSLHVAGIPPHLFLGGSLGAFMICCMNYAIARAGVMATLICMLISQLVCSTVIDHYGLFGGVAIEMRPARLAGILLIIAGAIFVLTKPRAASDAAAMEITSNAEALAEPIAP
jgi:bacterial/archaeal transporter family-2 protein